MWTYFNETIQLLLRLCTSYKKPIQSQDGNKLKDINKIKLNKSIKLQLFINCVRGEKASSLNTRVVTHPENTEGQTQLDRSDD